ncbi:MAG: phosphatidate cytidylyltransferase [Leptospirales bacterium]
MKDILIKILVGIVVASVYLFSFHFEGYGYVRFYIFILAVISICIFELFRMYQKDVTFKVMLPAFVLSFSWLTLIYALSLSIYYNIDSIPTGLLPVVSGLSTLDVVDIASMLPILAMFAIAYFVIFSEESKIQLNLGLTFVSFFYIAIPLSTVLLLRAMEQGVFLLWFLSFAVAMSDTMGFVFGKLFGKHKVKWTLSPNKTWEGYIGGFFGQSLMVILFHYVASLLGDVPTLGYVQLIFIAGTIYFVSVLGDLSESRLKRAAGVKDSGTFLPGHGGFLDRVDSIIFAAPFFYFLLRYSSM